MQISVPCRGRTRPETTYIHRNFTRFLAILFVFCLFPHENGPKKPYQQNCGLPLGPGKYFQNVSVQWFSLPDKRLLCNRALSLASRSPLLFICLATSISAICFSPFVRVTLALLQEFVEEESEAHCQPPQPKEPGRTKSTHLGARPLEGH